MFSRIDADKDGHITKQELLDSVRDFYFNDDPNSSFVRGLVPQS